MNDLERAAGTPSFRRERAILRDVADSRSGESHDGVRSGWKALDDLVYLYLVVAHATDDDLSEAELQVMVNKLREWQPGMSQSEAGRVLSRALASYAEGDVPSRVEAAIESVRTSLPRSQRLAALNDLIKIANADGVFLDDEEDLINHLMTAWEVDSYGDDASGHGSKA